LQPVALAWFEISPLNFGVETDLIPSFDDLVMAFLLPAVVALVCDICVVWLSSYAQHHEAGGKDAKPHWFYYTTDVYCGSLPASTRLFMLCVPLLYHSYTGTALRHGLWYQTIYIGMALLVVGHAVVYLASNPQSFESIFILPSSDPEYEYRRLWGILLLSTTSLISHNFLIRHVRSTAPTPPMMLRMLNQQPRNSSYLCRSYIRNTVQPTMYFAVRTAVAAAAATKTAVASYPTPLHGSSSLRSRSTSRPESLRSGDEEDAAVEDAEQEPALMHAMNGEEFRWICGYSCMPPKCAPF
jgi:hypothetical protein